MALSTQDRRDLIALWCHVAWADGVVQDSERAQLCDVLERLGEGAVTESELHSWLDHGPPEVTRSLPADARQMFEQEAIRLISADRDLDPAEFSALRDMVTMHFGKLEDLVVG